MPVLPQPSSAAQLKPEKLFYIDNIRILLTLLVVLHHVCVTYGASGGWYYKEPTSSMGALIPMTMFVSLNQSFFMGFFFLLAGFFTYPSYHRKGAQQFVADRLIRLGLPLLFYSFIFSPLLSYLVYRFANGNPISYPQYLRVFDDWIDFGVLWFVAALLLFTLVYVLCRKIFKSWSQKPISVPQTKTILLAALLMGLLSFMVRIAFPVGWVLKPVGFQPGHFTQYASLFIVGLLAAKNNWLQQLSYQTGKRLFKIALLLLLFFPVFYLIRVMFNLPISWYSGGFNVLSLIYAVWEQCIGVSIITTLLAMAKQRWNTTSPVLGFLSRRTFAIYIFHPLALISLSLIFRNWTANPALKLLLVAPLGVMGSIVIASLILLLPGVKKII